MGDLAFSFENALNESIQKLLIANGGSFGISPPSTPGTSRSPSPGLKAPNTFASPSACAPDAPIPEADSLPGGDKQRAKKCGHANRRKKRSQQLAKPGQPTPPKIRPSIRRKYICEAVGIQTSLEASKLPAASRVFVASRGVGGRKVYKLEELVGKDAKVPFKLVPWDRK